METKQHEESLRQRVRRQLMDDIAQMDFSVSTRMTAEKLLAVQLQVSRSTLRSVLTEMETEGKLIRRHGSGTYVNPSALYAESALHTCFNLEDFLVKNGLAASVQTQATRELNAEIRGEKLNLPPFARLLEIPSVYSAGNRPCVYCLHYLDITRFSMADWTAYSTGDQSVYDFLRASAGVELVWDTIQVRVSDSNRVAELRELFFVPKGSVKPVLRLDIVNFDSQNQPALLSYIYLDTDRLKLDLVRDLPR